MTFFNINYDWLMKRNRLIIISCISNIRTFRLWVQSISSGTITCLPMVTICAVGTIGRLCTLNGFLGNIGGKFTNVNNGTVGVPMLTLAEYLAENV